MKIKRPKPLSEEIDSIVRVILANTKLKPSFDQGGVLNGQDFVAEVSGKITDAIIELLKGRI